MADDTADPKPKADEPKPKPPNPAVKLASVHLENVLVVPVQGREEPLTIDYEGIEVPAKHVDAVWEAAEASGFPLRVIEQS